MTVAPIRRWAAPAALVIYVLALYGATAALQDGLFERDGYYHARLAQLFPGRGLSRSFPWTQLSTWRDRYCDKEVLFHAAMAPFAAAGEAAGGGAILGARAFMVLLAGAIAAGLWWVLRAHRVPWPAFFAAVPLGAGGLFLARLGMIRSHVLSMALLLVGVHLLLGRRWRALLVLGFVYSWCYTVPFVLVMTAAPFALGRWLGRGGLDWRAVVAAGGGAVLGLAVHPYTPLTLETFLTYLQVFSLGLQGAGRAGLELGNELYPYPLPVLWDLYPLLALLVAGLAAAIALRLRRLSPEALGAAAAALFWTALALATPRFVEYQALLVAVAVALVVRDLLRAEGAPAYWAARRRAALAVAAAALAALAAFHARSLRHYVYYQSKAAPARFFDGAGAWMAGHLAPGETVANLYWDDFPDLFYSAPRQHYLWGLDPTYSLRFDAARTLGLERVRRRQQPLQGAWVKRVLGTRWLILRASRAGAYPELARPPFREAYRDASAVLYQID